MKNQSNQPNLLNISSCFFIVLGGGGWCKNLNNYNYGSFILSIFSELHAVNLHRCDSKFGTLFNPEGYDD